VLFFKVQGQQASPNKGLSGGDGTGDTPCSQFGLPEFKSRTTFRI